MKPIIYNLAQVILASGILYAYYHFALRNKKFHRYNRFYLLTAAVLSLMIPFLNIPVYFSRGETENSLVLQSLTLLSSVGLHETHAPLLKERSLWNWFTPGHIALLFYVLISALALSRILFSLHKIRQIVRNNPVEKLDRIRFVNTSEPGTPFSFFRWLFWNRNMPLHSEKGEQVFRHEWYHIRQKHSLDILTLELITALLWINPFFHLVKKELKTVHEFLADRFAIQNNKNLDYAELLLMQTFNTRQRLVNPFFHNQIKRRITMLTTSSKPGYQYARKLSVLPLMALVLALFAFNYRTKPSAMASDTHSVLTIENKYTKKEAGSVNPTIPKMKKTEPNAGIPKNSKTEHSLTKDTIKNILVIIDGKEHPELRSFSDLDAMLNVKDIDRINVLKGATAIAKYGRTGANGAIEIFTRNKSILTLKEKLPNDSTTLIENANSIQLKEINKGTDRLVFDKVEVEPSFPGGEMKWKQYLEKTINPLIPLQKGVSAGTYTVVIQFIVNRDGFIREVKPLTHFGYGMEEEGIRIISKGPRWIPATQNGNIVSAYKKQQITFQISAE